jgi:hypothetical protein
MIQLLCVQVPVYLWSELSDRLRVADVQQVAHLQVARQCFHPLLPPLFHQTCDFLHLGLRKSRLLVVICEVV